MATIGAARFAALKSRVKAEMLRRSASGSVAAYGGADWDYKNAPAAGRVLEKEHIEKLTGPMRAVNADTVSAPGAVVSEAALAALESRMTVWENRAMTDRTATDCRAGCTGLCYTGCAGGCYTGCSGCSGCGGACSNSCTGGCEGCSGCSGGCTGCSGTCRGTCTDACHHVCYFDCNTSCMNGCQTSCGGGCKGTCSGNCTSIATVALDA